MLYDSGVYDTGVILGKGIRSKNGSNCSQETAYHKQYVVQSMNDDPLRWVMPQPEGKGKGSVRNGLFRVPVPCKGRPSHENGSVATVTRLALIGRSSESGRGCALLTQRPLSGTRRVGIRARWVVRCMGLQWYGTFEVVGLQWYIYCKETRQMPTTTMSYNAKRRFISCHSAPAAAAQNQQWYGNFEVHNETPRQMLTTTTNHDGKVTCIRCHSATAAATGHQQPHCMFKVHYVFPRQICTNSLPKASATAASTSTYGDKQGNDSGQEKGGCCNGTIQYRIPEGILT